MISTYKAYDDWNNREFDACSLSENGEMWLLNNQDKFEFKSNSDSESFDDIDDDLPF